MPGAIDESEAVCGPSPDGPGRHHRLHRRQGGAEGVEEGGCIKCNGETAYQDEDGESQCKPTTTCATGVTFEAVAPTPSTNRVCSRTTLCRSGEYEAAPPTSTTDRGCKFLRQCDARKQYVKLRGFFFVCKRASACLFASFASFVSAWPTPCIRPKFAHVQIHTNQSMR